MGKKEMSMAQRRAAGLLWVDTGENMDQQVYARGLCQDFNHTRGTETEKREEILQNSLPFAEKGSGSSRLLHWPWEIPYLWEKELMSTQI